MAKLRHYRMEHFLLICSIGLFVLVVYWQRTNHVDVKVAFRAKELIKPPTFSSFPPPSIARNNCENEAACRMKELRQRISHTCLADPKVRHNLSKKEYSGHVNHKHKLLYFSIPKVGCSFWKRIFKVLNSGENNKSMFDIPNYKAHRGDGLIRVETRREVDKYLPIYTSFAFVRDPFSRLFSGYIDKMFVPNSLGAGEGKIFFSKYKSRKNYNQPCVYDISFQDFAMYVADWIPKVDPHFRPMSLAINPCDVNLTHIGKMESFMEDTNFILSSVGVNLADVSRTSDDAKFEERHEKGYMEDIINRTFMFTKNTTRCISPQKILQRLWTTFHIRGYLSKSLQMPEFKNPERVTIAEMVRATSEAYDLSGPKSERALQRREAMIEAYSSVPRKTLDKLAQVFDMDCRVFEYNCNITERFPEMSFRPFYFK